MTKGKAKRAVGDEALVSWVSLNDELRGADEERCAALLAAESAGRRRRQFLLRIQSRLNRVRRATERAGLERVAAP